MQENPFTLTFGQKPVEFISRDNQTDKIINTFNMEQPSNQVFMIAGVRGSGKTVSLSIISDYYSDREDWIVLRLSADSDIISGAVSELSRTSLKKNTDININASLGPIGVSLHKDNHLLGNEALLRNMIEELMKHNKRILFVIDEIINNDFVKVFASNFQIYITQHYPVYLVMAGLYDNIRNLQNEKSLTFLYRAPKVFLEPLNLPLMASSYRNVFNMSQREAVEMARATKGYPFAFQVLGHLRWEHNCSLEELMPEFDDALASFAYEKIWSELSELDKKIVYIISTGIEASADIRNKLSISPQLLNVYRKRLMERGIVDASQRGKLKLSLPRFAEYINAYCEVEI